MKEVNPKETTRAYAFEMWMKAPMPMVTFFKTLNVSNLIRLSRNHDLKESMVIGTTAMAQYDIDGAVDMYAGIFKNPFMIWGNNLKGFFKTTLTVSRSNFITRRWMEPMPSDSLVEFKMKLII